MTAAIAKKTAKEDRLRTKLKRLFKDKLFTWFLVSAIALMLVVLAILALRVRPTDYVVPLQYSTLQGFDGLGAWYRVYSYGLFSVVVTLGNIWLASSGYDKSRISSFFLVMGSVVVNLFTIVVVWTLSGHLEV